MMTVAGSVYMITVAGSVYMMMVPGSMTDSLISLCGSTIVPCSMICSSQGARSEFSIRCGLCR